MKTVSNSFMRNCCANTTDTAMSAGGTDIDCLPSMARKSIYRAACLGMGTEPPQTMPITRKDY